VGKLVGCVVGGAVGPKVESSVGCTVGGGWASKWDHLREDLWVSRLVESLDVW
jgi:hypothetical protein